MSLLAGFDIVIELSRSKLVEYIRSATLDGQTLVSPTEVKRGSASDNVDLNVFQDVDVILSPNETWWATVVIPFEDSMITINGETLSPVKGTLFIHGLFDLTTKPGTDPNTRPFVKRMAFYAHSVTHSFDESAGYCVQALGELNNRELFEASLDAKLTLALGGLPLSAEPDWMIDDTQNGTIGGMFCSLTVAPISNEVLGLFGILFPRRLTEGDPFQKSGSVLGANEHIAVSLSPLAFHDLVFCPQQAGEAQAAALANQPAQLAQFTDQTAPPDCGHAARLLMPGGSWLTGIHIEFDEGVIHLTGSISHGKQGAYCFRVSGTFATDLRLPVIGGVIQPELSPNPPSTNLSIDVSWYCALLWIVPAVIGGAIALFVVTVVANIALVIANILVSSAKQKPTDVSPIQIGFVGAQFDSTLITREGLTLRGRLPKPKVSQSLGRDATLSVSIATVNESPLRTATYDFPGSRFCPRRPFEFTEKQRDQVATCTTKIRMMSLPRSFAWSIDDNPPIRLIAPSGAVVIQPYVRLPQPDGVFQQLGRRAVTLLYRFSADGSELTLTDSSHYCYTLLIRVDCSDRSGASVSDWLVPGFEGDIIEFGDDYKQFMRDCMIATRLMIDKLKTIPKGVPRSGDPGDLTETQVVQVIRQGILEKVSGQSAVLAEAAARFGPRIRMTVLESLAGPHTKV